MYVVWQELGATRFMHNPEYWGILQFENAAPAEARGLCRNVEWPVRHALTQVYRAEREMMRLTGRYTEKLHELLDPAFCNSEPPVLSCANRLRRMSIACLTLRAGRAVCVGTQW